MHPTAECNNGTVLQLHHKFPLKKIVRLYISKNCIRNTLTMLWHIHFKAVNINNIFVLTWDYDIYVSIIDFHFFFLGFDNFTLRNKYRIGNFFLINYFQKKIPVNSLKRALVGNVNCVHLRCSVTSVSSRRAHFEFNNKNMKRSLVLF